MENRSKRGRSLDVSRVSTKSVAGEPASKARKVDATSTPPSSSSSAFQIISTPPQSSILGASTPPSVLGASSPPSTQIVSIDSDSDGDSSPESYMVGHLPATMGCRSVDCYERLNTIEEGQYGVVHRAKDKTSGEVVALKKIKIERLGFPVTSLREINILLNMYHPNVVNLKEIVVGKKINNIFMVMEHMDHDMKGLLKKMDRPLRQNEVKCLLRQLLLAVEAMHEHWIIHRDLKSANLLYNNNGILKVCDFGMARKYDDPVGNYTELVVTLWYRAPELLLGTKRYSKEVDMWSVGCLFAEFVLGEPLMPGKGEFDQLDRMFKLLGTPTEENWQGFSVLPNSKNWKWKQRGNTLRSRFPREPFKERYLSGNGFDLLTKMLCYDPEKRISAKEALEHAYWREIPLACEPSAMPRFVP